jgi:bifunctional non-homologous end joining protein LigD
MHRMKDQRPGHWSPTSKARHARDGEEEVASPPELPGSDHNRATRGSTAAEAPDSAQKRATRERVGPIRERPMLATAATIGMLAGGEWALEWKWDGIRVLARAEGGGIRLLSRNGNDVTARYPELAGLPSVLAADALVDGEIVALDDEGRPSFEHLQQRMNLTRVREIERLAASAPVRLLLFDVLEIAGESVMSEPYRRRRELLDDLFTARRGVPVEVPAEAPGPAAEALEESRHLGLEGLVAKRPDSPYHAGSRSEAWLKLKLTNTQEVVIGGYRKGIGTRTGRIRSLLVGIPGEHGLEYAGRVGSGIRELQAERLLAELDARRQDAPPFIEVPPADVSDAVWVRPELVGEIEFGEWTRTGVARHPRWRGLRPDKSAQDVRRET